jgi:hypothetical protein
MYYVIKKQHNVPLSCFFCFKINKYITSKDSDTVIFEFLKENKKIRKWIKKDDIILLTEDEEFFKKTRKHFQKSEAVQQKLVDEAQAQLNKSITAFSEIMEAEINEFNEIKHTEDFPCELKDI